MNIDQLMISQLFSFWLSLLYVNATYNCQSMPFPTIRSFNIVDGLEETQHHQFLN